MNISVTNDISKDQLTLTKELVNNYDDFIINPEALEWSFEDNDLFLFLLDESIIGLATTSIKIPTTVVSEFLLFKPYRNKGLGNEIFNHFESELYFLGTKLIKLHSLNTSEGFWKKMGFKKDPSAMNNLQILFKVIINGNKIADNGEANLNIWDSHNKNGYLIYEKLSLDNLAVPCFMDWYVEIQKSDKILYQGKAKYSEFTKYYNGCLFSAN
ncbi:MAG: GNAT family N-acetyltransferase [Cytophagia bacterium]|nr:GNAT family N-acetyltransferase [Cytophagia bacterium]